MQRLMPDSEDDTGSDDGGDGSQHLQPGREPQCTGVWGCIFKEAWEGEDEEKQVDGVF